MENVRNINPIKIDKTTIINLEKGKLPPQVLDLEEAVLGAMMIDKKGVDEVIDIYNRMLSIKKRTNIFLRLLFSCLQKRNRLTY
jgi:hypothetical protein